MPYKDTEKAQLLFQGALCLGEEKTYHKWLKTSGVVRTTRCSTKSATA